MPLVNFHGPCQFQNQGVYYYDIHINHSDQRGCKTYPGRPLCWMLLTFAALATFLFIMFS